MINSNSSESDEDTNVDDNYDNEFGCVAATSSRKVHKKFWRVPPIRNLCHMVA